MADRTQLSNDNFDLLRIVNRFKELGIQKTPITHTVMYALKLQYETKRDDFNRELEKLIGHLCDLQNTLQALSEEQQSLFNFKALSDEDPFLTGVVTTAKVVEPKPERTQTHQSEQEQKSPLPLPSNSASRTVLGSEPEPEIDLSSALKPGSESERILAEEAGSGDTGEEI